MKYLAILLFLIFSSLAVCSAQQQSNTQQSSTVCTFADGKQISIRYTPVPYGKKSEPPLGKVWTPGDAPMYLFTEAPLSIGSATIQPGAYSLYTMPSKENWTIIVSHNVKDGVYDSTQDAARTQAQTGKLPDEATNLSLYLGHIAPGTCTLRMDYGKLRASTDFNEKN